VAREHVAISEPGPPDGDGEWALYSQVELWGTNLMLVENTANF